MYTLETHFMFSISIQFRQAFHTLHPKVSLMDIYYFKITKKKAFDSCLFYWQVHFICTRNCPCDNQNNKYVYGILCTYIKIFDT